jgi:hypothetical protein
MTLSRIAERFSRGASCSAGCANAARFSTNPEQLELNIWLAHSGTAEQ